MADGPQTLDDCSRMTKSAIQHATRNLINKARHDWKDEALLYVDYWRAYDRLRNSTGADNEDTPLSWEEFKVVLDSIERQPSQVEPSPNSQTDQVQNPGSRSSVAGDPTNLEECSARTRKAITEIKAECMCSPQAPNNFTDWRENPEVYFKYQRKHSDLLANDPEGKYIEKFDMPLTWEKFKVVLDSMK